MDYRQAFFWFSRKPRIFLDVRVQKEGVFLGSVAIFVESGPIVWPCCGDAQPGSQRHPCSGAPYRYPIPFPKPGQARSTSRLVFLSVLALMDAHSLP